MWVLGSGGGSLQDPQEPHQSQHAKRSQYLGHVDVSGNVLGMYHRSSAELTKLQSNKPQTLNLNAKP